MILKELNFMREQRLTVASAVLARTCWLAAFFAGYPSGCAARAGYP